MERRAINNEINSENIVKIFNNNLTKHTNSICDIPTLKLESGKIYSFGNMIAVPYIIGDKSGNYPAMQILDNKGVNIGYISVNTLQARKFIEIATSKKGNLYAKKQVMNTFGAPEGITYGLESFLKLKGCKIKCTGFDLEHMQPSFDDLNIMEIRPLTFISLV